MIRNLLYHCCPLAKNDVWLRNVSQLRRRLHVFNGRKIVTIAKDIRCVEINFVERQFPGCEIRVIENNAGQGEMASFYSMMDLVATTDPDHVTFYAHAKGVSRSTTPGITSWRNSMYHYLLDDIPKIEGCLEDAFAVGTHKMHHAKPLTFWKWLTKRQQHECRWHFAGTFFWFRHDAVFGNPMWRTLERNRHGVEFYLPILIPNEKAVCVYSEHPSRSIYTNQLEDWPDPDDWKDFISP